MDIFFQDPNEIPLPPEEIRIKDLRVDPYPDGKRLRVFLEVDPFQKKPNVELTITDQKGYLVSEASILESMTRRMQLTMHLRGEAQNCPHTILAKVYYFDTPADATEDKPALMESRDLMVVDQKAVEFLPPEILSDVE